MLRPSVANSGMMLFLVPEWICPTVTTAASVDATSLETTPWRRITTAAASSTGAGTVAALAEQLDVQRVRGRHGVAGTEPDHAGRQRSHVLAQNHIGCGHLL